MVILNIAIYGLKRFMREKTALFFTFLMPVVMIGIMGNINFGDGSGPKKIPVGVVNLDNSQASKDLLNEVKKNNTIDIIEKTEAQLIEDVKNSDVDVAFIIPKDFGEKFKQTRPPEITTLKLPSSADYQVIEGIFINSYIRMGISKGAEIYFRDLLKNNNLEVTDKKMSELQRSLEENMKKPPVVSVEAKERGQKEAARKIDAALTYTMGFTVMFLMWSVVLGAGEVLQEKKYNTWDRMNIAPAGSLKIMSGMILSTFMIGWIQAIFLILFSDLVMGISWGQSIPATLLMMTAFMFCVNCFGMFVSSLIKTYAQLNAISAVVITCTSMLAGCYWPLEIVPVTMQKVAQAFPQYWALDGLRSLAENRGIDKIVIPILVLIGMGLVFLALSSVKDMIRLPKKKVTA